MNYAGIKRVDVANGPGVRVSLFVSGCRRRCPECFNPETWEFSYGKPFDQQAQRLVLDALRPSYIKGLSLLGGEPFEPENQAPLLELARALRRELPEKDLWCYSGFRFESLSRGEVGRHARALLEELDVLVDGPFVAAEKNPSLRFRGSGNQRIILVRPSLAAGEARLWDDSQD